jgi:predicted flap endonuclease-1-like 5' DNA nuclease
LNIGNRAHEIVFMPYALADLTGIGAENVDKLRAAGIRTTDKLLDAAKDPKGRQRLADQTDIDVKRILQWANLADRMRIKGVGEDYAELLRAAGVDTVKELKYRNPEKLANSMAEVNSRRKLVRVLPSNRAVVRWIEHAKRLQLKIRYK